MIYFLNKLNFLVAVFVFGILLFSCGKEVKLENTQSQQDSLVTASKKIVIPVKVNLIPAAKKATANWKEFNDVADFIKQFYNINHFEALNNAKELSELVTLMKDSVRVEKLKELSVRARLNVLENETLRLLDITEIPSISETEVAEEVATIIELHSALISKINTIYKVEALQKALEVDTETPIEIEKEDTNEMKFVPKISSKKD